jgi:hypothetical protein
MLGRIFSNLIFILFVAVLLIYFLISWTAFYYFVFYFVNLFPFTAGYYFVACIFAF